MNQLSRNPATEARLAFGQSLRLRRKEKGLSQTVLAQQVGLTQAHVSKIEKGKTAVSIELASRLGEVVGSAISEVTVSFQQIVDLQRRGIVQQIVELSQGLSLQDLQTLQSLTLRLADETTRGKYLQAQRERLARGKDEARRAEKHGVNIAKRMADQDQRKSHRVGRRRITATR